MYRFLVVIEKADENYFAYSPDLPGCVATGKTREEALTNAQVIIKEWIKTAKELGRLIPDPKGRLIFA